MGKSVIQMGWKAAAPSTRLPPLRAVASCDDLFGDGKGSMPVGVLLRQLGAEVAGGRVDVDLALAQPAFEFGVAGLDVVRRIAGHDDDEVGLGRARQLAHLDGGFGKALGQPLEVVNELRALLQVEERDGCLRAPCGSARPRWECASATTGSAGSICSVARFSSVKAGRTSVSPGRRRSGLSLPNCRIDIVVGDARKGRGQRNARRGKARRQETAPPRQRPSPGAGSSSPDRPA